MDEKGGYKYEPYSYSDGYQDRLMMAHDLLMKHLRFIRARNDAAADIKLMSKKAQRLYYLRRKQSNDRSPISLYISRYRMKDILLEHYITTFSLISHYMCYQIIYYITIGTISKSYFH